MEFDNLIEDEFDDLFDLEDEVLDEDDLEKNRYLKPKKFRFRKKVEYKNAVKMANDLSEDILKGEKIYGLLNGSFIFGDFIEAFLVKTNSLVEELTISTLSLSHENIDSLHNLLVGGYIKKLNLIISDFFFAHNRKNINYIYEKLDVNNSFQLAVAGTHTKIILIKIGNKKIVMFGSMNLRSSQSLECISIESDEELYDFNLDFHNRILDKYSTIKKSIRGEELWQVAAVNQKG